MREFSCSGLGPPYRSAMTQERRSKIVFTATLVLVAAAWLFFLFAYADLIFRHDRASPRLVRSVPQGQSTLFRERGP
jgi:hypothetical protein